MKSNLHHARRCLSRGTKCGNSVIFCQLLHVDVMFPASVVLIFREEQLTAGASMTQFIKVTAINKPAIFKPSAYVDFGCFHAFAHEL